MRQAGGRVKGGTGQTHGPGEPGARPGSPTGKALPAYTRPARGMLSDAGKGGKGEDASGIGSGPGRDRTAPPPWRQGPRVCS